jgi:hypothetical protein
MVLKANSLQFTVYSDNSIFPELGNTLPETEVLAALKTLKLFIESGDILICHLTDLFNLIFDTVFV